MRLTAVTIIQTVVTVGQIIVTVRLIVTPVRRKAGGFGWTVKKLLPKPVVLC